ILPQLDLVLLMSVNPGFGGQTFIDNTYDKLRKLNHILKKRGLQHIQVEVDGGVKYENIEKVAAAGADILVCGSGIFKAADPVQMIKDMQSKLEKLPALAVADAEW
ncbi:MAG TPA: ribulose-phosphate 3-epimerase, partial [Bacteroidetes bacterium]|nr:ribulose-phosphate 3-epimerase [Bacteroidota bacterium]